MKSLLQLVKKMRHSPTDLVGIEVALDNVCAVRMRKSAAGITVTAAALLDPLPGFSFTPSDEADPSPVVTLPPEFRAKHAAIVYSGDDTVIKLLSFPGAFDSDAEEKLVQGLGLRNTEDYRIGYKVTVRGQGKTESRALGVGAPEEGVARLMGLFATGLPVPYSLDCTALAAMTAFLHGPGTKHIEECVGVINFGVNSTCFTIFDKGIPALTRILSVGLNSFVRQVQRALGVDAATASGILADGSFDVSQSIDEVVEPLVKQILLSRDFVERRENCHMASIYAMGHRLAVRSASQGIKEAAGIDMREWNPFDYLTVAEGALADGIVDQGMQLAPAIGACLGTFEDT